MFRLFLPSNLQVSEVMVNYKKSTEQDGKSVQLILTKNKYSCFWESKEVSIPIQDKVEYVYYYSYKKEHSFLDHFKISKSKDIVYEYQDRRLHSCRMILDIFGTTDNVGDRMRAGITNGDIAKGCWEYIKFIACHPVEQDTKGNLIVLCDCDILSNLTQMYDYSLKDTIFKEIEKLLQNKSDLQKQIVVYILAKCLPYYTFRDEPLRIILQKECLETFYTANITDFPTGSEIVLKYIANSTCTSMSGIINPFDVVTYFYGCLNFHQMKELISKPHKRDTQNSVGIGHCFQRLFPQLKEGSDKALDICFLLLEQIEEHVVIMSISKTISCVENIDCSLRNQIMDKAMECSYKKVSTAIEACATFKENSLSILGEIIQGIKDEDLQKRIKGNAETKVLSMVKVKCTPWKEPEMDVLRLKILPSFVFDDASIVRLLEEILRSNAPNRRDLFLKLITQTVSISEGIPVLCIDWLKDVLASSKITYTTKREQRITEAYKCLGDILAVEVVAANESLVNELEKIVRDEIENSHINLVMNATPEIEKLEGKSHDFYLLHVQELLLKRQGKLKTGKLNDHIVSALGDGVTINLSLYSHLRLVETILDLSPLKCIINNKEAANDISIILGILENIDFWNKIFTANGTHTCEVKCHIVIINLKSILNILVENIDFREITMQFAKKFLDHIQKDGVKQVKCFLKNAGVNGKKTFEEIVDNLQKVITDINFKITCVSDMFSWLECFDGVHCTDNRVLALSDLAHEKDKFASMITSISTDLKCHLSTLTTKIELNDKWYLTESVAMNDAYELESFHKFIVNLLENEADFIQKLVKHEIAVPISNDYTDPEQVTVDVHETTEQELDILDDMELSEDSVIDEDTITLEYHAAIEERKEECIQVSRPRNIVMGVPVSTFIAELHAFALPRFKTFTMDNIWSISNNLIQNIHYLFRQCVVDQEVIGLGKLSGKDMPKESQKLIKFLRCFDDYAFKASDIVGMCKVFAIDSSADSSLVGSTLQNILKIHEDKTFTVTKFYSCMSEFETLVQTVNITLWEMIHELSKCQGLIDFLHDVQNEDLRNLIDAVEEHSEQFVQESTVSDLIQVKSFLYPLLTCENTTSEQIVDELKAIFNQSAKTTPQMINNCSQNWNSLKALYMNVANRGEVTKEIVAKIMEDGITEFSLKDDIVDVRIMYMKGETLISYHIADLSDLRSRVLLISNTETIAQCANFDDKRGTLLNFVYVCDLIVDISTLLQSLCTCGHFDFQEYKTIKQGHYVQLVKELESLRGILDKTQKDWEASLNHMREQFYYLNFIHSKQFHILYDFFQYGKRKEEAIAVIKYIKPNLRRTTDEIIVLAKNSFTGKSISQYLESMGHVLHIIIGTEAGLCCKFPAEEEFWKYSENVDAKVHPGKVYVAHVDVKSIETVPILLSLYANTTKLLPLPNEVLFCNEDTTWEEVYLIIKRCTLRPNMYQNNLYCIAGVENLHYEIQYQLVQQLREIEHNENSRSDFLLAVLCRSVLHDNFLSSLSQNVHKAPIMGNNAVKQCLAKVCNEVYMITSDLPGQGKTEKIYSAAAANSHGVVTVPISGPVSKGTLVKQMNRNFVKSYHTLHLDIGSVDQPHILDNFLFELIVLKCAMAGVNCAHLNTQSVAIEIANTLNNSLPHSLYVGTSFQRIHIQWMNFREFVVSSESESAVQTVCKYMFAIENNIYTQDIKITSDEAPLSTAECHKLLQDIFGNETELSYTVVNVFLQVLADQLKRFSASHFFKVSCLTAMLEDKNSVKAIRKSLLDALIKVSKEFSCCSITTCKTSQHAAVEQVKYMHKTETDAMLKRVDGMIRWSDSNHLLVLFQSQDSQTVSSLYREVSAVPIDVKRLIETQTRKPLPDLNKYSQNDLQKMLEKLVCTSREVDIAKRLGPLYEAYALTPDNILKMILVIMRIRTGIPVILMGETGCGKTTLVKYLALTCSINLKVFQFHAGVTKEGIVSQLQLWNEKAKHERSAEFWVFLDEINTCDHLGLLKEIICHKSCDGKNLAPNLAIIAACNPYRNRDKNQVFTTGLQGKAQTDEFSQLVYRVHPLPEAMIDFVWDYGVLHKRDEISYIECMVQNITDDKKFMNNIIDLLAFSQNFIRLREKNSSSVSLRDIERCRTLIMRFHEFLQKKDNYPLEGEKQVQTDQAYFRRAVLLSLSHCYEVRLTSAVHRKEFWEGIALIAYKKAGFGSVLMKFVHKEQMDILNRMILPQGIAKNSALRENVFVLFICILYKIPVFLVGKPGCSKSLSIQLLKSSLRGPDSDDEFLKTLPQLYIVSYQGSESSTSEGIIKVFEKAERYKKHNNTQDVLPVVLLDEVGLAEISHFNPLKVLHSLLEPATGEYPDVAVVGISNWALDAAKMNRAIHLSRPDLTIDELLDTAIAIKDGLDTKPEIPEWVLNSLARAYYEYQSKQPVKNFHGLRDYYSLVKYVCGNYPTSTNKALQQIRTNVIQIAIERNLGGYKGSKARFVEEFLQFSEGRFSVNKFISTEALIKANLIDQNARHLMVITSGDYCMGIIANLLKEAGRNYEIIFGSQFEEDLSEEYSYRILSKIILCMEQGMVLILKDLEGIYGSLYDMLNQNYTVVGMKKNCRIALGAHSNPMCVVHDNFRCIVMVDSKKVDYSDPPFLNRFEKQILNFEHLLQEHEKTFVTRLGEWIKQFSTIIDKPYKPEDAFLAYHKETLPSLLHHVGTRDLGISEEETLDYCKSLLLKTCPPDAILRLAYSELSKNHDEDIESIQDNYFHSVSYESLQDYLDNEISTDKDYGKKVVILTRSNINTNVEQLVRSCVKVQVDRLGSFKSEKHLTQQITNFFVNDRKLMFMQCSPSHDSENMLLMKLTLETHLENYIHERNQSINTMTEKHVIVVIHINRQDDCDKRGWQVDYTNEWNIVTVDRLESSDFPMHSHVLGHTVTDLLQTDFVPFQQVVKHSLIGVFSSMKYTTGSRGATSIWKAVDLMQSSVPFMKFLQKTVLEHIELTSKHYSKYDKDNWQVKVANKTEMIFQGYPLLEAWKIELQNIAKIGLTNVLLLLENTSSWYSFIECHNVDSLWLNNMWYNIYEKLKGEELETKSTGELFEIVQPPLSLKFPFSQRLVGEFLRVEALFFSEEDTDEIVSWDELDPQDMSYIIEKYSCMIEQIYEEHTESLDCDDIGITLLEEDMYNILSYSPDIKIEEDYRTELCKLFIQAKLTNIKFTNYHAKLCLILLTWSLQKTIIKGLLRLASICGHQIQNSLKQPDLQMEENNAVNKDPPEEITDDKEDPHPEIEEVLVNELCLQLVPTEERLINIGRTDIWFTKVSRLLAFASKVSFFPHLLHFLRLCVDVYTYLPDCETRFKVLSSLCSACTNPISTRCDEETESGDDLKCEAEDLYLDSLNGLVEIDKIVSDLMCNDTDKRDSGTSEANDSINGLDCIAKVTENNPQKVMCLYFARCIDANLYTPRLHDICDKIRNKEISDNSLRFAGPVVQRLMTTMNFDINLSFLSDASEAEETDEDDIILYLFQDLDICNDHPLHGLCLDIIEKLIKEKVPANEESLDKFQKAYVYLQKATKLNRQYFECLAYVRLYLQWSVKYIHEMKDLMQTEIRSFLQRLDCAFTSSSHKVHGLTTSLQVYFLKLLHNESISQLKEEVGMLEEIMSSFQSIEWPMCEFSKGICINTMCVSEFYPSAIAALTTGNIDDVISSITKNKHTIRGIVGAVTEKYYWKLFVRPLSEAESLTNDLLKHIESMDNPVETLMKCCFGYNQFQPKSLQISTQWNYEDCLQASFLLHITTTLAQHVSIKSDLSKTVWVQMMNSSMREALLKKAQSLLSSKTVDQNIILAKCLCGHILINEEESHKCTQCENSDLDLEKDEVSIEVEEHHIVQKIFHMCIYSCIIGSMALELQEDRVLAINPEEKFKSLWKEVESYLNLSKKNCCLFLNLLLVETEACCELTEFLHKLNTLLISKEEKILHYKARICATQRKEHDLTNILEEVGEFISNQDNESYFIHRKRQLPSIEDLKCNIKINIQTGQRFPFLKMIVNDEEKLELMNFVPNILKWYLMLHKFVHHKVSRKEANTMKISDFIHENTTFRDMRRMAFDKFQNDWNNIRKSKYVTSTLSEIMLPEIFSGSPIDLCIVQELKHPMYKVFELLCQIQNEFLKKAAYIALNGCTAIAFLCNDISVAIPFTLLHTSEEENIVHLDWSKDLLNYSQNSLKYGFGEWVQYDIEKIEREMADSLLIGKCYLILDENFPTTVYQHELFHRCTHILTDIRKEVKQSPLPDLVTQRIRHCSSVQHGQQSLRALLNYLEIVISLVQKTKGHSFVKIGKFSTKWGISEDSIQSDTIRQMLNNDVSLGNVVALYEQVEDEIADVCIDSLSNHYSAPLSTDLVKDVDTFLNDYLSVIPFITAVRRYTVRYLSVDINYAKPHMPMSELMCQYSMWSSGVSESGHLANGKTIDEVFPVTLLAEHTRKLYDYLQTLAKKNEKGNTGRQQIRSLHSKKPKRPRPFGKT